MIEYTAFVVTTAQGEPAGFAAMSQQQLSTWRTTPLDWSEPTGRVIWSSVGQFLYEDHSSRYSLCVSDWQNLQRSVSAAGGCIVDVQTAVIPRLWGSLD